MIDSVLVGVPDDAESVVALVTCAVTKERAPNARLIHPVLDGTLPDPEAFDDLPGGASGPSTARKTATQ